MALSSRIKRSIINTFSGLASQLTTMILNFAMRTVFVTALGIQYVGVTSVFSDLLNMLSFTELGIGTAIATALYKPIYDHNFAEIQKFMRFYRDAYRFIAVIVCLIGVGLLPFLNEIITNVPNIKESIQIIFILYIVTTAVSYLLIYRAPLFSADQRQSVVNVITMMASIIKNIVEIIVLLMTHMFMSYLIIEVIASIGQNIWLSSRAKKEYPGVFVANVEKLPFARIKKLLRDIKGLAMYQFSGSIGNSINSVMVSSLISTGTAGLLANYTLIQRQVESLVRQFFSAIIPSVGNLVAEGDDAHQFVVFKRIYFFTFVLINFCSTCFFALIAPFIELWLGKQYVLSWPVAFVIAIDSFLYMLLQAVAAFRTANGIFVQGQYRPLLTAVLNILFTFFFVKHWGIAGAIGATIFCRLLTQWYDPYLLYKLVFKKNFKMFILKNLLYAFIFSISLFLMYVVRNQFSSENLILKILIQLIFAITIPNLIVVMFLWKSDEFKYYSSYLKHHNWSKLH